MEVRLNDQCKAISTNYERLCYFLIISIGYENIINGSYIVKQDVARTPLNFIFLL